MDAKKLSRRKFFSKATALTAATAAVYSWEEYDLLAQQEAQRQGAPPEGQAPPAGFRGRREPIPDIPGPMPMGKLGDFQLSRLIAGHNIVMGQAHARDLIYTSQLLRAYFTDEKILETFAMYEEKGINASFARTSEEMIKHMKAYTDRGGKLIWISGLSVSAEDQTRQLDMAVPAGAKLGYVHGNSSDRLFDTKRIDIIAKSLELMRKAGLVAGVCCHKLEVPMALEKEGIKPDFYVKTFHSGDYWSAGPPMEPDPNWKPTDTELVQPELGAWGTRNNIWDTSPKQTAEFMAKVKVPWIGFKVLAAGALHPQEAFKFCFEGGTDFVCAGMYDFQVAENANITKQLFLDKDKLNRTRPWLA